MNVTTKFSERVQKRLYQFKVYADGAFVDSFETLKGAEACKRLLAKKHSMISIRE